MSNEAGIQEERPVQTATDEEYLKKKHDKHRFFSEILLMRRKLSSDDLKVLVKFAERFDLNFDVQENLGEFGWMDRRGLIVSISDSTF